MPGIIYWTTSHTQVNIPHRYLDLAFLLITLDKRVLKLTWLTLAVVLPVLWAAIFPHLSDWELIFQTYKRYKNVVGSIQFTAYAAGYHYWSLASAPQKIKVSCGFCTKHASLIQMPWIQSLHQHKMPMFR